MKVDGGHQGHRYHWRRSGTCGNPSSRIENLFKYGEWALLEWFGGGTWQGEFAEMAPNGRSFTSRGCGFFHVTEGKIRFQLGYFDKATWFGQLGIPLA